MTALVGPSGARPGPRREVRASGNFTVASPPVPGRGFAQPDTSFSQPGRALPARPGAKMKFSAAQSPGRGPAERRK